MKTVREWLENYEWFPKVEHNVTMQEVKWTLDAKDVSAAEALLGAFSWYYTPEGYIFWQKIYENLKQ